MNAQTLHTSNLTTKISSGNCNSLQADSESKNEETSESEEEEEDDEEREESETPKSILQFR